MADLLEGSKLFFLQAVNLILSLQHPHLTCSATTHTGAFKTIYASSNHGIWRAGSSATSRQPWDERGYSISPVWKTTVNIKVISSPLSWIAFSRFRVWFTCLLPVAVATTTKVTMLNSSTWFGTHEPLSCLCTRRRVPLSLTVSSGRLRFWGKYFFVFSFFVRCFRLTTGLH